MGMDFKFQPNANAERDLERMIRSSPAVQQMARNVVETLDRFQVDYAGREVAEVKPALASAWATMNPGAHLGEPALSQMAEAISERRRVWIDERGHIMVEDDVAD